MLEEIALSISTAIFFLCTAVVGSCLPSEAQQCSAPVSVNEVAETENVKSEDISQPFKFDIVGTWKSGGHTFEFRPSGRLIFDGRDMAYSLDGNIITVTSELGGTVRTTELAFVPLSERVMKINGITAYKTEPQT